MKNGNLKNHGLGNPDSYPYPGAIKDFDLKVYKKVNLAQFI
jgi:hypothetical protein